MFLQRVSPLQSLPQPLGQGFHRLTEKLALCMRPEHGQQCLILQTNKIFPQKIARPQNTRQILQRSGIRQKRKPLPTTRQTQDIPHQVLKTRQGGKGIRGPSKKIRELFGEQDRKFDAVQDIGVFESPSLKVSNVDLIFNTPVNRTNSYVFDGDIVQREGIG